MRLRLWSALFSGLVLGVVLAPSRADAFPWMITHGYTSCAACHVDPGGGGQVTAYGRAISDLVVRWHLDPADLESGEPSPTSGFLFGLVPMPEWLEISGNLRGGAMLSVSGIGAGSTTIASVPLGDAGPSAPLIPLLMASDLRASLMFDPVIVHASVGYGYKRAGPAAAFSPDGDDVHVLTSREHWVGLKLFEDSMMVRAGRMPVPFGLRNIEHTSFVRASTRTDINVQQQHGVAVSFANELARAEVMAVLGNYQLRPDEFRERGYSGYLELAPLSGLTVGASSLLTFAALDIETLAWRMRQSHGLFTRWAPTESMALMAEADALIDTSSDGTTPGGVAWAQLDWQPIQGIHVMPALEARHRFNGAAAAPDLGVWASAAWYALPHTELRADVIYREAFPAEGVPTGSLTGLLQLHLFL
jgi:hypothetical protein